MEPMPEQSLYRQWRKMSFKAKEDLIKTIAEYQAQFWKPRNRFQGVSNINRKPQPDLREDT
ncbi:uncharacterized protein Z518_06994 [Rhinocladiella mackenziei CBS 650.93]|uniref:Uncharacterized protein n=1 Tax=Rhinocladiella mackenziei CBS 650.93 TaxID=1442369 RepID=A0A0D2FN18_9EURO|nr:uncharacterized protein Z518_06994 [Rhinocladiella mackenziei CBS 650.93]KIX03442.1 hypothetical protein Z518_06994 [Rhinocladiella mackenziei CBS 650.93]